MPGQVAIFLFLRFQDLNGKGLSLSIIIINNNNINNLWLQYVLVREEETFEVEKDKGICSARVKRYF